MFKYKIPAVVKDIFEYDPETGIVIWKKHPKLKGKRAGSHRPDRQGYRLRFTHEGTKYNIQMARVIWYLQTGEDPGDLNIDHIDRNRNNNVWTNLRLVSQQINCFNRSGVKGYCRNRNRWRVDIRMYGKSIAHGSFKTEEEARAFYEEQLAESIENS